MSRKPKEIKQDEWIDAMFKPLPQKPLGWFTANEIAERTGANIRTVRWKVLEMVKRGELLVMDCLINGKSSKCYKRK